MKIWSRKILGFTLWIVCMATSLKAQQTYLLQQQFSVGKQYEFQIKSEQILDQEQAGRNVSLNQQMGTNYLFEILSDSTGYRHIKVIYKQLTMRSASKGNEINYNSDLDTLGKKSAFGNLKGAYFNLVLSPDGTIKAISGLEKIIQHLAGQMAADSSELAYYQNNLGKQFSAAAIKETLEASFKVYPAQRVKVGSSWTIDTKIQMSMPVENTATYTLKEVKGGVATLSVQGILRSVGSFDMMGKKAEADLKGTNSGEITLNLKTGMIISSHLRVDFFGKIDRRFNFEMEAINDISGREL